MPQAGTGRSPVKLRADKTLGGEIEAHLTSVVLPQADMSRATMALGRLGERIWLLFRVLFVGRVFDAAEYADGVTCLAAEDLASCVE